MERIIVNSEAESVGVQDACSAVLASFIRSYGVTVTLTPMGDHCNGPASRVK